VPRAEATAAAAPVADTVPAGDERPPRRGRRGRGGRGRDREDREPREGRTPPVSATTTGEHRVQPTERPAPIEISSERPAAAAAAASSDAIAGETGQRLTRSEAFDLVKRAVGELALGDTSARASDVRRRARQLLGRDSESLSDRMFVRILKDAHDAGIVDLRRRGDDFEVARAAEAAPVAEQLARSEQAATAAASPPSSPSAAPAPRIGMGHRGARPRGPLGAPPPGLLSIGVVEEPASVSAVAPSPAQSENGASATAAAPARGRGRGKPGAKAAAKRAEATHAAAPPTAASVEANAPAEKPAAKAKRGRAAKKGGGPRGKKTATPAKA